jgi:hypothetical protein
MTKTGPEIGTLLASFRKEMRAESMRLQVVDRKIKGRLTRTWMPKGADAEYRDLFRKAAGPWLEFTRDGIAQGISVDGCNNEKVWVEAWQSNGMDGRQDGTNRETVGIGKSFILTVPAGKQGTFTETVVVDDELVEVETQREVADNTRVVMRALSSLVTYAHFADPWDDRPTWVLTRVGATKPGQFWNSQWVFIDDEALYRFHGDIGAPINVTVFEHELDYCPVARIANTLPAIGEPESSVERAFPVYERIVDATFTLEMKQRYGAFPQKWATGGTPGVVNASVDSMVHNTAADARFGNFAEGSLADVVAAIDAHIKHLAAVCQVPPHYLLGAVVNMSAEGIAAAESGYFRNIRERQTAMSEGYELALRTAGEILGLSDDELDAIEVHFEDVSSRSLAQIADAIGKLALLMPDSLAKLFAMLPGFTQLDANDAAQKAIAARQGREQRELASAVDTKAADKAKRFTNLGTAIRAGADPESAAREAGLTELEFIPGAISTSVKLAGE